MAFALDCAPAEVATRPVAEPAQASAARVVVVGDVLGDRGRSDGALARAGVMSADGHWTGGTTVLVQLGDLIDPGPDTKAVVERWMALEPEAAAAGGKVIVLLGDHEALDLRGEGREFSPIDIASFGDATGRMHALSASEPIGKWLRTRDVAADVGGSVLVHAGISEKWAEADLASLSSQTRAAIGRSGPDFVLGREGPVRYRGYVQNDAIDACGELKKVLAGLGAERMVVGHGPSSSGQPEARCDGRLVWVASSAEAGAAPVVEIAAGTVRSLGPEGPVALAEPR